MTGNEIKEIIYANKDKFGKNSLIEDNCILDIKYNEKTKGIDMIIKRSIDEKPYFVRASKVITKDGRIIFGRLRKASAFYNKKSWYHHIVLEDGMTTIDKYVYGIWEFVCKMHIGKFIPKELREITDITLNDKDRFEIRISGCSGVYVINFISNETIKEALEHLHLSLSASRKSLIGDIKKKEDITMFFITCFEKVEKDERGFFHGGAQRTFGFRTTLQDAEAALNNNVCDMRETVYDYAVIEEFGPYIHPIAETELWFKWNDEKKGFFRIEKPNATKGVCNFALG